MRWVLAGVAILLIFGGGYMSIDYLTTQGRWNDQYDNLFLKFAKAQGIDPKILKAIAMNESGPKFNFTGLEPIGGTTGILHIKLSTAQDYEPNLTAMELQKPEVQIRVASKHLKRLLSKFNNNIDLVVMAYNTGEGNVQRNTIPGVTYEYLERFKRNHARLGVS